MYFCDVKPHQKYMKRCIELSKNGLGNTYPNPMVGSVIVYDDKIIGEGWHQKSGEAHAEVNAINSVSNKSLLTGATIYVSLEPCSHFGKTPPCCDLIIKHQIPNIVVGTSDPNPVVAGNGIKKLIESGLNVASGIIEGECIAANKRFFTFHQKKRPYIILKWAESRDGHIAPEQRHEQKPVWISNGYSRQLVHKWRSEEHAILIGTKTAIADNPKLDVREWTGNNPVRVVIDRTNRIPKESHIFDNRVKTIVISEKAVQCEQENIIFEVINFRKNIADEISSVLYKQRIQSVIIEGGRQTLQTFIDANMWDEARVFTADINLKNGVKAPNLYKKPAEGKSISDDELLIFWNHD